jgi:hypothetical protein
MTSNPQRRPQGLAELVAQRLFDLGDGTGSLSMKAAVDRAKGRISYENFRRIARGEHGGQINDRIAEGLALALDVPLAEVYRVAGLPQPSGRWEWPTKYDRLDIAQRRIVEDVADGFLTAYDKGRRDALG